MVFLLCLGEPLADELCDLDECPFDWLTALQFVALEVKGLLSQIRGRERFRGLDHVAELCFCALFGGRVHDICESVNDLLSNCLRDIPSLADGTFLGAAILKRGLSPQVPHTYAILTARSCTSRFRPGWGTGTGLAPSATRSRPVVSRRRRSASPARPARESGPGCHRARPHD